MNFECKQTFAYTTRTMTLYRSLRLAVDAVAACGWDLCARGEHTSTVRRGVGRASSGSGAIPHDCSIPENSTLSGRDALLDMVPQYLGYIR